MVEPIVKITTKEEIYFITTFKVNINIVIITTFIDRKI